MRIGLVLYNSPKGWQLHCNYRVYFNSPYQPPLIELWLQGSTSFVSFLPLLLQTDLIRSINSPFAEVLFTPQFDTQTVNNSRHCCCSFKYLSNICIHILIETIQPEQVPKSLSDWLARSVSLRVLHNLLCYPRGWHDSLGYHPSSLNHVQEHNYRTLV